jgi:AraC-like DNA-binding protein
LQAVQRNGGYDGYGVRAEASDRGSVQNDGEPHKYITEISMETGFADYKSFYTAFTKRVGMTPSEYRKRMEETT